MTRHSVANFWKWILAVACLVPVATSPLMAQADELPPAAQGIEPLLLLIMAGAAILLALLIWGIKQPLAWIVVSFLAVASGVGCTVYGCVQAFLGRQPLVPLTPTEVQDIGIFIGSGVGFTVAGIVLLVVALVRLRKKNVEIKP